MEKSQIQKNMDPYKILGVPYDASANQIKQRMRALSKEMHPDKSKAESEEYKQITQAYDVLKDLQKRGAFDRKLLESTPKLPQKNESSHVESTRQIRSEESSLSTLFLKCAAVLLTILFVIFLKSASNVRFGTVTNANYQNPQSETSIGQLEEMKNHFSVEIIALENRLMSKLGKQINIEQTKLGEKYDNLVKRHEEIIDKFESVIIRTNENSNQLETIKKIISPISIAQTHVKEDLNSLKVFLESVIKNVSSLLNNLMKTNSNAQSKITDDYNLLNEKLDFLTTNMTTIEGKFDSLTRNMTSIDKKIDSLTTNMTTIDGKIDSLKTKMTFIDEKSLRLLKEIDLLGNNFFKNVSTLNDDKFDTFVEETENSTSTINFYQDQQEMGETEVIETGGIIATILGLGIYAYKFLWTNNIN